MDTGGNELRRKALMDQMGGSVGPARNTGISGFGMPGGVEAPPIQAPADAAPIAAPAEVAAPAAPAQNYAMTGFDAGKLADTSHNTPKYQIARAVQGFDPKAGFTPDVMAKLNGLGIGQFSNKNDKLHVENGSGEFKGMTDWDGIKDSDGNAAWQFGVDSNLDAPTEFTDRTGPLGVGGNVGLDAALQGDPMSKIQQMIEQLSGSRPNFDALMAQLGAK